MQNGIFERLWIGLFLLCRKNLENISRILIFADLDLPRKLDDAKSFHFTVLRAEGLLFLAYELSYCVQRYYFVDTESYFMQVDYYFVNMDTYCLSRDNYSTHPESFIVS